MTNSSPRRVLVAVEKPAATQYILDAWPSVFPNDIISFYYVPPVGRLSFRLPRQLPISSVPTLLEPRWKLEDVQFNNPKGIANNASLFSNADLIVCATDPDPTGAFNFHKSMECLGVAVENGVPWLPFDSLDAEYLRNQVANLSSTLSPEFVALRRYGEARRYFDYNYIANALPCLGATLRKAGAAQEVNFISKNAIQLIIHLVGLDGVPLPDGKIIQMMVNWHGSGKYPKREMGSPISRSKILEDLIGAGLLEEVLGTEKPQLLVPSELGRRFVASLHKDLADADLPARLSNWASRWPDSKPEMERYLRTFFGKQKRYMGSI